MKTLEELKKLKSEYKPYFPKWLLKLLSYGEYNKMHKVFGIRMTSQQRTIFYFVLLTIFMLIGYNLNDHKPTFTVWLGVVLYIIFFSSVLLMMGLVKYNNYRIKKICKENGITLEYWNSL